jgi:hypothetical protein
MKQARQRSWACSLTATKKLLLGFRLAVEGEGMETFLDNKVIQFPRRLMARLPDARENQLIS